MISNYKKTLLSSNSTIKHALEVIDSGAMKIGAIVDHNGKLLGTITDGDIRRALLNGFQFDNSIEEIYCKNPTVCGVNDSKEKIIQVAITKKIYQIPIVDDSGFLIGIEDIDELLKASRRTNKVVIMAGGLGSRLSPLTDNIPKPMLPVGKKPILETVIENFSKYGFVNIFLCVNHKSHAIENYFGDGSSLGVNIEYVHEEMRMGTAGSLSLIRNQLTEPFFVMNADLLTNINFDHMRDFYDNYNADAAMAVREYDTKIPYGVVSVKNEDIISIEEKPTHKFFVSGGIYFLSPVVLDFIPDNSFFDMPNLFEELIKARRKVISFPVREYWLDIGRISDYEKANSDYFSFFES